MGPIFTDRAQAGAQLVPRIQAALPPGVVPLVIALPRGGVPVAQPIAAALHAPLDVVLVRKLGVPNQPELAVGAIADGQTPTLHINPDIAQAAGLSDQDIQALARPALAEIARRRALWQPGRVARPMAGQTVVVVDDGAATGASLRAALAWLKLQRVGRLIVALPVAPQEVVSDLAPLADRIICLATPRPFYAVGAHFADFPQVTDAEVTAALTHDPG
jgi:putative phosphoribosyl transferase